MIWRKATRKWLRIRADHNPLMLFRFGAGMSGQVGAKGHWDQKGDAPDHWQRDFQATIYMCLSAPRKNSSRRVIPADRRSQLVNPQICLPAPRPRCRPLAVETLHRSEGVAPTGVPQEPGDVVILELAQLRIPILYEE